MYNFMKQNYIGVERGVGIIKRKSLYKLIFDKKKAERSKNEEIKRKKDRN